MQTLKLIFICTFLFIANTQAMDPTDDSGGAYGTPGKAPQSQQQCMQAAIQAAMVGNIDEVQKYFYKDSNAFSHLVDGNGNNLAHIAAMHGHVELLLSMNKYCGFIGVRNNDGDTIAHTAARHGQVAVLEWVYTLFCKNVANKRTNMMRWQYFSSQTNNAGHTMADLAKIHNQSAVNKWISDKRSNLAKSTIRNNNN